MIIYSFRVYLSRDLTDDEVEVLYGDFYEEGGVHSAVIAGVPELACDLPGETFDAALRKVLTWLTSHGIEATRIEIEPDGIAVLKAA